MEGGGEAEVGVQEESIGVSTSTAAQEAAPVGTDKWAGQRGHTPCIAEC